MRFVAFFALVCLHAQTLTSIALSGHVTSAEEGQMEGVLVSAKKAGSTMTITVVSDERGQYRFPASKLPAGQYALRIRAAGYDLEGSGPVEVSSGKASTADLKLRKAADFNQARNCALARKCGRSSWTSRNVRRDSKHTNFH